LSSATDALFDPLLQHQTGIIILILGPTFVPIGSPPSSQLDSLAYSNHLDLGEIKYEPSATTFYPTELLIWRQTGD
jgi:hypothetical protein